MTARLSKTRAATSKPGVRGDAISALKGWIVGSAVWAAEGVGATTGLGDGQVFDDFAVEYVDIWQEIGEK